jgi:hypothetical protein
VGGVQVSPSVVGGAKRTTKAVAKELEKERKIQEDVESVTLA